MAEPADVIARYKALRKAALALNNRLVDSLSRSVLDEGGKKLGILKGNKLFVDTEDVLSVLMDFCIYDVRRRGVNAIERFMKASPPAPGSDEHLLLQSMSKARFTLMAVEGNDPGVGVSVRDLLRDETIFLVDIGFSHTAPVGLVLAARLHSPEGITMTTGAALPVGQLTEAEREVYLQGLSVILGADLRELSPEQGSRLAALVIRSCLEEGAAERIGYVSPGSRRFGTSVSAARPPGKPPARNAPCPCGSGQLYKRCCGSRPR